MGGFRAPSKMITLEFEDADLKGLEIRVRAASFGQLQELMELAAQAGGGTGLAETVQAMRLLTQRFVDHVAGWNLEHEVHGPAGIAVGWEPTPITVQGLSVHDPDLVMSVVFAWVNGMTSVGKGSELGKASSSGSSSVEESMPMDVLSPSLPSFFGPSSPSTSVSDSGAFPLL